MEVDITGNPGSNNTYQDTRLDSVGSYNPNATTVNNYFNGAVNPPASEDSENVVIILGAGVESVLGMPTSASLIPQIVDYIATEEGQQIDAALRKTIGGVRFHFDKFVSNAIDHLAKDLDHEIDSIVRNVTDELATNPNIDEAQRKMGNLVIRLFSKVRDIKNGAAIDEETGSLIEEALGMPVTDESIIDFSHVNYTETFKTIIVEILQRSMHDSSNPILRHVYKNILDIERLLTQYFFGFYSNMPTYIRTYLYISWMLWAYMVHEEQRVRTEMSNQENTIHDGSGMSSTGADTVYSKLANKKPALVTFNYTTFAKDCTDEVVYFNGNLMEYVDIENKNEFRIDNITNLDVLDFIQNRLTDEISLDGDRKSVPIPSFLPPLKLKPVISNRYIDAWYKAGNIISRSSRILILGYSFATPDDYFCDMLRGNRNARIVIVNKDLENVARNACRVFQLPSNRYSKQVINGIEHRTYDNRIEIIGADLSAYDVNTLL